MLVNLFLPTLLFSQTPHLQPLENSQLFSITQASDISHKDWNFQALETLIKHHQIEEISLNHNYLSRSQFINYLKIVLENLNSQQLSNEDLALLKQLKGNFYYELEQLKNGNSYLLSCLSFFSQQTSLSHSTNPLEVSLNFSHNLGDNDSDNLNFQADTKIKVRENLLNNSRLTLNLSTQEINSLFQLKNYLKQETLMGDYPPEFDIKIEKLSYRFPLNSQLDTTLSLMGNEINSRDLLFNQPNIDFVSRFSRKNPLYRLVEDGGITLNYKPSDTFNLRVGYYAGELKQGNSFEQFLSQDSSLVAQLRFNPNDHIYFGFLYIYSRNDSNLRTGTGSERSQLNLQRQITANSYGFETAFQVTPQLSIGGWIGLTPATVNDLGQADIVNYAITLGFSDISKQGDFLGIIIGQEPRLTGTNGWMIDGQNSDPDTSLSWELLYHYPIHKNLSITPSLIGITSPDHNANNPNNFIFTLRVNYQF
jgi:hypothetical protein